MRKGLALVLALSTMAACSLLADEEERIDGRGVLLVSIGKCEKKTVDRLQAFLATELDSKVRVLDAGPNLARTADAESIALTKFMGPKDACVLAVIDVPENRKLPNTVAASQRVAWINAHYSDAPSPATPESTEKSLCRIEEDAMRSIALLLSMPRCLFPLCALHYEESAVKEGDVHSRNLCPPCQGRARELLKNESAETPTTKP
jgi:hypothetical protein